MTNESTILKIQIPFEYNKIIEILNKQNIKVIKTIMYEDKNKNLNRSSENLENKYVIFVIMGDDVYRRMKILREELPELNLYFSTPESYEKDFDLYVKSSISYSKINEANLEEMDEKTLAVISPSGYKKINEILKIIKDSNLIVDDYKITLLTDEMKQKYNILDDCGNVMFLVLRGYQAVSRLKSIVGATSIEGTIKNKFGEDSIMCSKTIDDAYVNIDVIFGEKIKKIKKGF